MSYISSASTDDTCLDQPSQTTAAIDLSRVTLWSGIWSADQTLLKRTLRVLKYCQRKCTFKRTVLFSCLPAKGDFDLFPIPCLSREHSAWNVFVNRIVPYGLAGAEFAMSVHEDGFPLLTEMWSPEFLEYDYIGAPWKDGVVGNGGFNIESRKMIEEKLKLPFDGASLRWNSDGLLCCVHRQRLEEAGVTFAPCALALRFSTETFGNQRPSFGFHGRACNPGKYKLGWHLIEQSEKD